MNVSIIAKATKTAILSMIGVSYLLSEGVDSKTIKGQKEGVITGILYMMPTDEFCPLSELAGCREGCLVTAGRAAIFNEVNIARKKKGDFMLSNIDLFFTLLFMDIRRIVKKAAKLGMACCIRLNGTTDIRWSRYKIEGKTVFEHFPEVQFYDYAKSPVIAKDALQYDNYHVTLSFSKSNQKYVDLIKNAAQKFGANLAVVFRTAKFPEFYLGRKVINGDATDLRFMDDSNVVVALKAKGKAKKDTSGFVVDAQNMIGSF